MNVSRILQGSKSQACHRYLSLKKLNHLEHGDTRRCNYWNLQLRICNKNCPSLLRSRANEGQHASVQDKLKWTQRDLPFKYSQISYLNHRYCPGVPKRPIYHKLWLPHTLSIPPLRPLYLNQTPGYQPDFPKIKPWDVPHKLKQYKFKYPASTNLDVHWPSMPVCLWGFLNGSVLRGQISADYLELREAFEIVSNRHLLS